MISYLREGWKKEPGCETGAERMEALLANIDVLNSNTARDEWISQLEVHCFDGGRWCRQR